MLNLTPTVPSPPPNICLCYTLSPAPPHKPLSDRGTDFNTTPVSDYQEPERRIQSVLSLFTKLQQLLFFGWLVS